jgi:PAS domain S-box-containing protein
MERGADGYLCKPFEPEELCVQIRALLRVKRYEDELRGHEERLERELAERTRVLRERERQLQSSRDRLEEQVQARTAELSAANAAMQTEIAERRTVQAQLEKSREIFHNIVEQSADGILVVDDQGVTRYANPAAIDLLGSAREDVVDCPFRLKHIAEAAAEVDLGTREGMRRTAEMRTSGTEWDGRPATRVTLRDVTARKQMEEELVKAQKLESVGILAGGIAHDFNNILMGVIGNLSFAKMEFESPEIVRQAIEEAEKSASRAKLLTQQLLTFSKGGAPVRRRASVGELLQDAARFVLAGSRSVCRFAIAADLWPAEIDVGQISQVVENLVINADQAMPSGGVVTISAENVTIRARAAARLPFLSPGRYLHIRVSDTGVGIQKEHLQKIFDPYFTTKKHGSGLGLATVYSIVRRHEGLVQVESDVGKGATFTIYLPASEAGEVAVENQDRRILKGSGRILLMDDEAVIRRVASRMLASLGYSSTTVEDGAEAVAAYAEAMRGGSPFRAAILDLTVPGGMGGETAVKELLALDPGAVAIVSSGYADGPVIANFADYGFKAVVTKPYDIVDLSRVLGDALA